MTDDFDVDLSALPHANCDGPSGRCKCGGYWHLCRENGASLLVHSEPPCALFAATQPCEWEYWAATDGLRRLL